MSRLNRELALAGWRLHRIYPPRKWSPMARVAVFHRDMPREGHRAVAEVWLNINLGLSRNVTFWVDRSAGDGEGSDLAEEGVGEAVSSFQSALARCPNHYPLSRSEHIRQRQAMLANPVYRAEFMGEGPAPDAEANFPEHRAAGPPYPGGGENTEPDI